MKKLFQRAFSAVTAAAIAAAIVLIPKPSNVASAQSPKIVTGVRLNELERPGASKDYWSGDLVYFGSYKGYPLRFRVMEKYGGESYGISENVLTLDCDNIVDQKSMLNGNENFDDIDVRNIYDRSPMKEWLNSTFYNTAFTDEERALIAKSTRAPAFAGPREGRRIYSMRFTDTYFFPLTGAHIHTKYGIPKTQRRELKGLAKTYLGKTAEEEFGSKISYWLCCTFQNEYATPLVLRKPKNDYYPDIIRVDEVTKNDISVFDVSETIGVSPMMNIRSDSILFTSKVDIPDEKHKDTYKLTLQLDDMVLTPKGTPTRSANTVTVDYTKQQGADRMDRVSVVITDKGFYEDGAKVLYYSEVVNNKFTLSDEVGRMDSSKYHAYIVGEELHGECECDYASAPQEISIPTPQTADTIFLSAEAPEVNVAYSTPVCTSDSASIISYCWRNVYNNDMQVTGTASYDTLYSLTVTLKPKSGIQFTENTAVTGIPVDTVTINKDNTLTVVAKFPVTRKKKVTSLWTIDDKEFPHGSTANDVKNGLPKSVVAVTEENGLVSFKITWDYSTVSFDPAKTDSAQEFYVYGTFDPKNYDTTAVQDAATGTNKVQIKVTVCTHTPRDAWAYDETVHYKLCNAAGCEQKMNVAAHDFVDEYDKEEFYANGKVGSLSDYPIKKCTTCLYKTRFNTKDVASVTTIGSSEPKLFTNFKIAWFYAKDNPGSTLKLLSDVTVGSLDEYLSIDSNHALTIDLSKYTLEMPSGGQNNDLFTINGGSLTVMSSDPNGYGYMTFGGGRLFTVNSGSLTIDGGTYHTTTNSGTIIYNAIQNTDCKITISGGNFLNVFSISGGSVIISDGKFNSEVSFSFSGNNTIELSGGEYAKVKLASSAGRTVYDLLNSNYEYKYNLSDQGVEFKANVGIEKAEVILKSDHQHTPQLVAQVDATCTKNGTKEHYECSCGKIFRDSTMTQEVPLAEFAIPAAHVGGTATCKDRAVCTRCGREYGELSDEHDFTNAGYGSDDNGHWLCCTICSAANGVKEVHSMTASTDCTQPDSCKVCGYSSGEAQTEHAWSAWTIDPADPERHTRTCTNNNCTASESETHSGGTASCTQRAVCDFCGAEYGDKDPTVHSSEDFKWDTTKNTHILVRACCNEAADKEFAHDWTGAYSCRDCGYVCAHSYDAPDYMWSSDGAECTATRLCDFCDSSLTEDAAVTTQVIQEQSCTDPEISNCTAKFTNSAFAAQIKQNVETKPALGHSFSDEWSGSDSEHWHQCIRCDEKSDISAHSGGTADCLSAAECEICGKTYGSPDPDKHNGTLKYVSISEIAHRQEYSCCGKATVSSEPHDFDENKVCRKCGYGCTHSFGSAAYTWSADGLSCTAVHKCTRCSYTENETVRASAKIIQPQTCVDPELTAYTAVFKTKGFTAQSRDAVETKAALGHNYSTEWSGDSAQHWHQCIRCDEKSDISAHSGGTADCLSAAECEICGKTYGSPDPDKHNGTLKYVSISETAHRQEYSCCGKVTVSEEPHEFNSGRICEKCGYNGNSSGGGGYPIPGGNKPKPDETKPDSSQDDDNKPDSSENDDAKPDYAKPSNNNTNTGNSDNDTKPDETTNSAENAENSSADNADVSGSESLPADAEDNEEIGENNGSNIDGQGVIDSADSGSDGSSEITDDGNPATGITISFASLFAAGAAAVLLRKKK